MSARKVLIIVSRNKKKKDEILRILRGFDIKALGIDEVDASLPVIIEDGKTFKQNAIKKAVIVSKIIDGLILADDSGLIVDCLDGKPGVRSSRFAHAKATDDENCRKLLKLMQGIPSESRTATFICGVAVANKGILLDYAEGSCKGSILYERKGAEGFGYDSVFIPDGYKSTFAEIMPASKDKMSHRAEALKKVKEVIQKYFS